jgi:hypothetical protein
MSRMASRQVWSWLEPDQKQACRREAGLNRAWAEIDGMKGLPKGTKGILKHVLFEAMVKNEWPDCKC